jgi:hypothetical protein
MSTQENNSRYTTRYMECGMRIFLTAEKLYVDVLETLVTVAVHFV